MSLIGALTKTAKAGEAAKKTAPFYSAVDETLANLKRNKGTGVEFLTEVMKTKGVKPAEIADRKLEQAFKAKGKMTKEEAQQILADNPPPKLKEKVYDESTAIDEADIREAVAQEMFGRPYDEIYKTSELRRISDEVYRQMDENLGTKFGKFKTEGGENYREILLKLPKTRPDASNYTDPAKYDADLKAYNASGQSDYYHPNHFSEDANIVAHMRVQDRMIPQPPQKGFYAINKTSGNQSAMFDTPEELQAYVETLPENIRNNVTMAQGERKVPPKKVLQIEEIQSDWHQAGRKKGYGPKFEEQYRAYYTTPDGQQVDIGFGKTPEEVERMTQAAGWNTMPIKIETEKTVRQIGQGVPDAPFKKNWRELAMKRLLNYAADNNYDSIAITPGVEQAKFYDLSKQIDALEWDERTGRLYAKQKDSSDFNKMADGVTSENLSDYVGKEVAERMMSQPSTGTNRMLSGVNLEVGGESLKDLYDNIIPNYLNTFGKPYGAQVGQIGIRDPNAPSSPSRYAIVRDADNNFRLQDTQTDQFALPEIYKSSAEAESAIDDKINRSLKLHNFPITPEMRESIKQKGLPLYQQVGIPTAGAGAASQMLEPEEEAGLAGGGSVAKLAALAKLKKMREEMAPRAAVVKDLMAKDSGSYLRDVTPDVLTKDYIEQEIQRMAARAEASKLEVKEAKGGEVRMTKNRDAMFMELSNKKLKRK